MPKEIKPAGLPGERCDLSDIFSALPSGLVTLESSQSVDGSPSSVAEKVGDQFRRLLKWIESNNWTYNEIPVRSATEYTGLIVKVAGYFSVQRVGRGKCVVHINNRLDCQPVEGDTATIRIDKHGLGTVTVQSHVLVGKGGRAD